MRSESYWL